MPELLLELFSEEIPARMQKAAAENLVAALTQWKLDPERVAVVAGIFV